MRIYKQLLDTTDRQRIKVPHGYKLLTVQMQCGMPALWYLCNPLAPLTEVVIDMRGTGHDINTDPGKYLGTIQLMDGDLIFHVFAPFEAE